VNSALNQGFVIVRNRSFQYIVLILLVTVLLIAIYRQGKKVGETELPTIPTGGTSPGWNEQKAQQLAREFYEATSYFELGSRKEAIYKQLLALFPNELAYVYNVYQKQYAKTTGILGSEQVETMLDRLESFWKGYLTGDLDDQLIARLKQIGAN
jgi:hypothetical protein